MKQQLLLLFFGLTISILSFAQIANQPTPLELCDDNVADNITTFDLTVKDAEITGGAFNLSVTYHLTQADADNGVNPIANPNSFTNTTNPQTLFVRVEDLTTGNFDTTTLQLRVLLIPTIGTAPNIERCDDTNSGDMTAVFDLTQNDLFILNGQSGISISYYTSLSDAESGANMIPNPINFTNTSSPQTVYAGVENDISGCYSITNFDLIVNPLPQNIEITPYFICDVNGDGVGQFDLTIKDNEILNGQNPSDFIVTYYATQDDAHLGTNPLASPYTNTINPSSIFVSVININTGCVNSDMSFNISVKPLPTPTQPTPLLACDADGDGFTQFDLSTKVDEIVGIMPNVIVTFHETLADAEAAINPLTSPYNNLINPQTIYVRDESGLNGCYAIVTLELQAISCPDVGQIVVQAFFDSNENSVFDANETNFLNGYFIYELNDDGVINTVNSSSGSFTVYSETDSDSYDFGYAINPGYENCYAIPTANLENLENITAGAGDSVFVQIPVVKINDCQDLAIYLYNPFASPRPGFTYSNTISLTNLGTDPIESGSIEFLTDASLLYNGITYINSNYTVTPISGGVSIDFSNLMPNEVSEITVSLTCPNTVGLGTLVTNTLNYTAINSDVNVANNTSILSQTVIGSYDPNDIIESHGPKIDYDDFVASDEYLYYTMRFQNVGTAEAINIRIEDVLDAQLDANTFQMLRSSHENVVTQSNNELIWKFDNINLSSESMDAEGSNGFVYFKIKPQSGYAIGDVIPNVADIYFDFNSAITTNMFTTEFVETLSVNDFDGSNFSMYPNPANRSVTLQFNSVLNGSITIFDIQGKTILDNSFSNENSVELNVSTFESGLYFVKLNDGSNESIKKLIID